MHDAVLLGKSKNSDFVLFGFETKLELSNFAGTEGSSFERFTLSNEIGVGSELVA